MDCGTGKTPVAIEWMKSKANGMNMKFMVVCPVSIIESVWEKELKKWWPEAGVFNLRKGFDCCGDGTRYSTVYLINYESYRKYKGINCRGIILDESQKIKDPRTKISRLLRSIKNNFRCRLILTGSPAPNNILEYWPQINFVDESVLDKNFYAFRNKYFVNACRFIWWCPKSNIPKIMSKIKQKSVFLSKDECLDLPDETTVEKVFDLDRESKKIYKNLIDNYVAMYSMQTVIAQSELVEIMKLRQITSGFFIDDTGSIVKFSDSKLKVLEETLSEIGNKQTIIWCQFRIEIKQITKHIGEDKCSILQGGMSDKERNGSISNFRNNRNQYLLAHPRSGSLGLDFHNASYSIFYSMSYSLEEEYQAKSRIRRKGQMEKQTYIYLMARDTIDQVIFRAVKKKENVSEKLLAMLANSHDNFRKINRHA